MSSKVRLPDFLIIGAQKAGTSTLYRDLLTHPRVYFPADKEPHCLVEDHVLSEIGRAEYASLFDGAEAEQICGEASTGYSKRPDIDGVAHRALRLLGSQLKVIYVVREPVGRVISQHHHMVSEGEAPEDINVAVRTLPSLVNYSRYMMQLQPWLDSFGGAAVQVVQFEQFVADRRQNVIALSRFLGIEPKPELIDDTTVFNKSSKKPVCRGGWRVIQQNFFYRKLVRPMVSLDARRKFAERFFPKAPDRLDPPSIETVDRIIDAVGQDVEQLSALVGVAEPMWNLAQIRQKHAGVTSQKSV